MDTIGEFKVQVLNFRGMSFSSLRGLKYSWSCDVSRRADKTNERFRRSGTILSYDNHGRLRPL
jgi:hypothetical protein